MGRPMITKTHLFDFFVAEKSGLEWSWGPSAPVKSYPAEAGMISLPCGCSKQAGRLRNSRTAIVLVHTIYAYSPCQ